MFKNNNVDTPEKIADYLSNHENFKTHSKHLNIVNAKDIGLRVIELESDQHLQEKVLSAFHATLHTLNTTAVKIISNQNGNAFIKQMSIPAIRPSR